MKESDIAPKNSKTPSLQCFPEWYRTFSNNLRVWHRFQNSPNLPLFSSRECYFLYLSASKQVFVKAEVSHCYKARQSNKQVSPAVGDKREGSSIKHRINSAPERWALLLQMLGYQGMAQITPCGASGIQYSYLLLPLHMGTDCRICEWGWKVSVETDNCPTLCPSRTPWRLYFGWSRRWTWIKLTLSLLLT